MELFIILSVLYFPIFIWLSITFVGNKTDVIRHTKRKQLYVGFLLMLSLFHFTSNTIFNLNASYGLRISVSIILLFSIFMLGVLVRDKQIRIIGEEN